MLHQAVRRLSDPQDEQAARLVSRLLLLGETLLCSAILYRVPYTKIDWDAYMQQVTQVREGERDYTELMGETGPCVYPAGFIYAFWFLQWATGGGDVPTAQIFFAVIYILTQAIVFEMYIKSRRMPPWSLCLLCLSKRLHSIYLLRLFNDGLAMFVAYGALFAWIQSFPRLSVTLFSLAVSIKMNVLLMAPSVFILLLQTETVGILLQSVGLGVILQIALGLPFLMHAPRSYIVQAFDLSRVFTYEWTVNLKFLPEAIFVSRPLATALLVAHAMMLSFLVKKWCPRERGLLSRTIERFVNREQREMRNVSADHILFVVFSGNFIGILCARSLHYQFFSWYFHSLPFLLWCRKRISVPIKLIVLLCIELCWNVFPSTSFSSLTLLSMHLLILIGLMTHKARVLADSRTD